MPSYATLTDPKSAHVLAYATLLGSNLFQTFLAGPLAFKALPRASFSQLQQAIFPAYFTFQTALPVVLALTWPGEKTAGVGKAVLRQDAGYKGLFADQHMWTAMVPIAIMFSTSLLNLVAFGPMTTKVMKERKHQETRDGKKYHDPGPKSAEMQRLNKSFGRLHGVASLLNLFGTGAMVYYGLTLAEKL